MMKIYYLKSIRRLESTTTAV